MISETRLARGYSSFWRSTAPTMELYVKRCNLDGYDRNFEPIVSVVHPDRRAITNQVAFEVFAIILGKVANLADVDREVYDAANMQRAINNLPLYASALSDGEATEASLIARRMWLHFNYPNPVKVEVKPRFKGCGIVLSCLGDAIVEEGAIIEFKDGDRPFRSYEFRQLSVYAALYYNQYRKLPTSIGVLNSRRGTYIGVNFEDFVSQVSGRSSLDYVYEIIEMISEASVI